MFLSNEIDLRWLRLGLTIQRGFVFSLIALIGVFQILFLRTSDLDFNTVYFNVLIIVAAGLLWRNPVQAIAEGNRQRWYLLVGLFIAATLIKIYFNSWIQLKGDELLQFKCAGGIGPLNCSLGQQQPPLHYFLSALGGKIFGATLLGIRFFNSLVTSIFVVSFFIVLKIFSVRTFRALASTILLFTSPFIFNFLTEARPYGLALLLSCFFLMELILCHSFYRIAAIATLLLLSVGFQPPILLAMIALLSSISLLFESPNKKLALHIFSGVLIAVVLFLPLQLAILQKSQAYLINAEQVSPEFLKSMIAVFKWPIFYGLNILAIVIFCVGLLFATFKIKNEKTFSTQEAKRFLRLTVSFLLFASIFILGLAAVFIKFINWDFRERYFLLGILCLSFGFIFLLNSILSVVTQGLPASIRVYIGDILFFLCIGGVVADAVVHPHWMYDQRNHKSSVALVVEQAHAKDFFLPICPLPIGCWSYNIELDFYTQGRDPLQVQNLKEPISFIFNNIKTISAADHFYVHLAVPGHMDLPDEFKDIEVIHAQYGSKLLKLSGPQKVERVIRLLKLMNSKLTLEELTELGAPYEIADALEAALQSRPFSLNSNSATNKNWEFFQVSQYFLKKTDNN